MERLEKQSDFNKRLAATIIAYWQARGLEVEGAVHKVADEPGVNKKQVVGLFAARTDMINGLPRGASSWGLRGTVRRGGAS